MHNMLTIKSRLSDYPVDWTNDINDIIQLTNNSNTITIIDRNVSNLYPQLCSSSSCIVIPAEEYVKSLDIVSQVTKTLIDNKANTRTKLVAIGGGIIQDLVGFVASIYCRGIDYILVPTTLLAQADSCIGGKTSINHNNRKNILGTFYPPKKILIYPGFLNTLPSMDYISGWGEIYKFHILQGKITEFSTTNIESSIQDSIKYKASILAIDEFDKAERKWLNYGHTFGHALESVSEYKIPHGLGVILGCMIATKIAYKINYDVKDYNMILSTGSSLLKNSGIKLQEEWFNFDSLIEIVKSDKKSTGELTMVLVSDRPHIINITNTQIVKEALNEVYESI